VLTDHRPGEAAAWQGAVDRDGFASLVLKAHLQPRQVQLVRV
jgi:glutamate dehydrogenase